MTQEHDAAMTRVAIDYSFAPTAPLRPTADEIMAKAEGYTLCNDILYAATLARDISFLVELDPQPGWFRISRRQLPVEPGYVLVVEQPDEDPLVVEQGSVTTIITSAYPLSIYCPKAELRDYDAKHYANLIDEFKVPDGEIKTALLSMQSELDGRRKEKGLE